MNGLDSILGTVGLAIAAVGVWFAFRRVALLVKQMQKNDERERIEKALSYSLTKDFRYRETRMSLDKGFGDNLEGGIPLGVEQLECIKKNSELKTSVTDLLLHWENMALAIYSEVAVERVAFEMVAGVLVRHVKVFRPFLDASRPEGDLRPYFYLQQLYHRWELMLQDSDVVSELKFSTPPPWKL